MSRTHSTIGAVAKCYDITTVSLRYYQKIGLLNPSFRNSKGYRLYATEDITRLHFIINAKNAGFTLEEIKSLFLIIDTGESNKAVKKMIQQKVKTIHEKILNLKKFKLLLEDLDNTCHKHMAARDCPIIHRLKGSP